jgi:ABC-type bacteriocin/lantibiotic exporter with double-glycine peptidase domain
MGIVITKSWSNTIITITKVFDDMKRDWLVPEVIQVSQMDCGPSCLKSLLDAFNIPVHYGRLREACQTDVDGTSINTIEELACELGLKAQQVLVPLNQFELPESAITPSILVTKLPNGLTHFIVVWRSLGPWVQIMDPSSGRQWISWESLKNRVYRHRMPLEKTVWLNWASSDDFKQATQRRLQKLGITESEITTQLQKLQPDSKRENHSDHWLVIASFDAALTWAEVLHQCKALNKGQELLTFLSKQFSRAIESTQPWVEIIPRQYWWAVPHKKQPHLLMVEAAVAVRIQGVQPVENTLNKSHQLSLNPNIKEIEPTPWQVLINMLLPTQKKWLIWLLPIIALAATTVTTQALLFQGLIGMNDLMGNAFNSFIPLVFLFIVFSCLLEFPIAAIGMSIGRQLENQFRIALFEKIPKIHDPYFRTRLLTDMARRSHKLHQLRNLPAFAVSVLHQIALVIFTLVGIFWLDPKAGFVAGSLVLVLLLCGNLLQKILQELVSRAETQSGALNMLYFDSLKGLSVIRSHAAQQTFATESEIQLRRWGDTYYQVQNKQAMALLGMDLLALLCIAALMYSKTLSANALAPSLLWFYWLLRLPFMVKYLNSLLLQIPNYRLVVSQFSELLHATETENFSTQNVVSNSPATDSGVAIEFIDVALTISGHHVLHPIHLSIKAGEHIAIVGESGAGKSSLCELLLGWHVPSSGQLLVDKEILDAKKLQELRAQTAWVDANVQLWDKSLLENINYDHGKGRLSEAGLGKLLGSLENGLQTTLGEEGKRLSGGEGQRVRIARALGVENARLVILDEPCRGLDRTTREELLMQLRNQHVNATFICVTHDISEAIKFPRVLVISKGKLLEQGEPHTLLAKQDSELNRLRECELTLLNTLLHEQTWQSFTMQNGQLQVTDLTDNKQHSQEEVTHV